MRSWEARWQSLMIHRTWVRRSFLWVLCVVCVAAFEGNQSALARNDISELR